MPHNIKVIVQKGACMTDTDVIRSYTHMIGYFDKKKKRINDSLALFVIA